MKRVVIAGSEGFIGQNLKWALANSTEYTTFGLDKFGVGKPDYAGDLMFYNNWPTRVNADVLVCLASEPNVWGRTSLLDLSHESKIVGNAYHFCQVNGIKKLIHLSSSNVYGHTTTPVPESALTNPISDYGYQKLMAETTLRGLAQRGSVSVIDIRMFNAIGWAQRHTMFPYLIVASALHGTPLPLYGMRQRAWTPVIDLCRFLERVIQTPTVPGYEVYNYGNTQALSQKELLSLFAHKGIVPVTYDTAPRPEELQMTVPLTHKAESTFGLDVMPSQNLEPSIQGVIDYARAKT